MRLRAVCGLYWSLLVITIILTLTSCAGCSRNGNNDDKLHSRNIRSHDDTHSHREPTIGIPTLTQLPQSIEAEVVGIQDGDTIELKVIYEGTDAKERKGKNLRIRFLHINCPEKGKDFYQKAKQFTSEACFRQVVSIRHEGEFDRYGRLLGEVILPNGVILNKELVRNGLAVHFKKYSDDQEYAQLEVDAQNQRVGIWSEE